MHKLLIYSWKVRLITLETKSKGNEKYIQHSNNTISKSNWK